MNLQASVQRYSRLKEEECGRLGWLAGGGWRKEKGRETGSSSAD